MKAVVVYDSMYGNTEKIAMAEALRKKGGNLVAPPDYLTMESTLKLSISRGTQKAR